MWSLLQVEDELRVLQDVDPEAQRQTGQKTRVVSSCIAAFYYSDFEHKASSPVGLPDVQNIRISDLHAVCLSVQEVKVVFDGRGGSAVGNPPDGPEEVSYKRMHGHLGGKRDSENHSGLSSGVIWRHLLLLW